MSKKAMFISMLVIASLFFLMFSQDMKASEKIEDVSSGSVAK